MALAAAIATASLVVGATPAAAHTELIGSEPSDGAVLDDPPTELLLRFSGEVSEEFATVVVTRDGVDDPQPVPVSAAGDVLTADLSALATDPPPASGGTWQVDYRIVSVDGHPIEGSLLFTVAPPALTTTLTTEPATPAASPTVSAAATSSSAAVADPTQPAADSGPFNWPVLFGAALAITVLVLASVARLRRNRHP